MVNSVRYEQEKSLDKRGSSFSMVSIYACACASSSHEYAALFIECRRECQRLFHQLILVGARFFDGMVLASSAPPRDGPCTSSLEFYNTGRLFTIGSCRQKGNTRSPPKAEKIPGPIS